MDTVLNTKKKENSFVADPECFKAFIDEIPDVFDAWQSHLDYRASDKVLSDTLGNHLSRQDVDTIASKVNGYLRSHGIGKEDVVLIKLDRGVKPFAAAMGVWKAGAAFTIAESDYAEERVTYMKKDCAAKLEINEENWPDVLSTEPVSEINHADPHDLAMIIYTSGTMGKPKGVLHEYGQIQMEMVSERRPDGTWRENRKTKWALGAPMNFVASLKILVHFMYCGGHLFILDYDTVKNPRKLDFYFLATRINEVFLAPMHLRVKQGNLGPFMKYVYTGAAAADNVSLKRGELVNTYTMTESFFTATEFIIDKPYAHCPVGKPLFDLDIHLLDAEGKEVAPGETGEIVFPNPYCRGYLNLPQENSERFINGYFHTNDLAALSKGMYMMRGRSDEMIKINGNRVEPMEIETVFRNLTGLNCAVKCFADDDDGFVALYYVNNSNKEFNVEEIRERLASELPYYMIPSYFEPIAKIPMTRVGKVDRKQLRKPQVKQAPYVAPETPVEEKLCQAAEKILGLKKVGRDDNVFELGCGSLDIISFIEILDLPGLSVDHFYQGKTIAGIAERYVCTIKEENGMTEEEMELEGRKHQYPLRDNEYILHVVYFYTPDQVSMLNLFYGFELSRLINLEKLCQAINDYTAQASTFQTAIVSNGKGATYRYAPEWYHPVKIENMSQKKLEQLRTSFVRPFNFAEELPWEFRLVKTPKSQYVFFNISHILTDGEGLTLLADNIFKMYEGKEPRPDRFFAYLYQSERMRNSPYYEECKQRMHARFDSLEWAVKPFTQSEEIGFRTVEYETGITLSQLEKFMQRHKCSRYDLFVGAMALALRNTSGNNLVSLGNIYGNRKGVDNIAGCHFSTTTLGFDLNEMPETVLDYLSLVAAEIREGVSTQPYCYRFNTVNLAKTTPIIDDLGDLEELRPPLKRFVKYVGLGAGSDGDTDTNKTPSITPLLFYYLNRDGKLVLRVQRDVFYLTDKARDIFAAENIELLQRLMKEDDTVLQYRECIYK